MRMGMENHSRENKPKRNIPIRAAAVLLCLTLVSTYLVSGLFARYAIRAQGSDSARVAKFSIEGSGTLMQTVKAELIPGKSETATLIIQNNSEVAVEYTVTVTKVTNNLPLSFRMEKKADSLTLDPTENANGITLTGQRLPGSYIDEYTLYIDWDSQNRDPALMGMVDYITVTVTAAQID